MCEFLLVSFSLEKGVIRTDRYRPQFRFASILGTSAGYGIAELSGRLVQFATTFYLAHQCTEAEFGVFGFLIAVQQVVALLGQAGLVELLTGRIAKAADLRQRELEIETVYRIGGWYRIGWFSFSVVVLLLATLIGNLAIPALLLLAAAASGFFLSKFYLESAAHQIVQHRRMAILFKVGPIILIYGVGAISFSLGGNRLLFFFIGALTALFVLTFIIRASSVSVSLFQQHNVSSHGESELVRQTLPYLAVAVLGWITGYGNTVIIKFIFDSEAVARYTLAFTLTMPIFMLCNVTNQAWNPKFIELSKVWTADDLNHANAAASALQILLVSISAIGLLLFSPLILKLMGGHLKAYADVVPEAGIMMLGYIFLHLYYRVSIFYLVNNESKRFMLNSIASGLVGLLISVILMLSCGTIGIYIGFAVANALLGVLFSSYARVRWSVQWPIKNLILAVVGVAGALLLSKNLTDIFSAIIAFCIIISFLLAVWFGFNRKLLRKVQV
jgi:O-antigen/teichoic acid export membrane protein